MLNKITIILSICSVLLCVSGMVLAHTEMVSSNVGGLIFALSGVVGLASLFCAVLVLFITKAYPVAIIGIIGMMPLVAVVTGLLAGIQHPPINDISTDVKDPPVFVDAQKIPRNQSRDMGFPPDNAEQIELGYPNLKPLALNLSPQQAYERALEVAETHTGEWEITRKDEAALSFEGVAVTKLFRWRDDFIVRVRPADGGGSRLDMRSKSRDGKGDLGANARRIERFFAELEKYDTGKKN